MISRSLPRSPSPSAVGLPAVSRRSVLGGMLGAAGTAVLGGCTGGSDPNTLSFGNNASDEAANKAITAVIRAFEKRSGLRVDINTKDHETYQEQISNYLQSNPDDVFAWFAGYRMQVFAERGLAADLSEIWSKVGDGYTAPFREVSTGQDGKQYFIPFTYYPWVMYYRPSVWRRRGYSIPATFDDLIALARRMRRDGLTPLAFAQQEGWPALGTFDHLNLRINGYGFHSRLVRGQEDWAGKRVREVFDTWRRLLPYQQRHALGRDWPDAAQTLADGDAGMYLIGAFMVGEYTGEQDDLDFFPFPEINPEHGMKTVEAPIDGYMMVPEPDNRPAALELLEYLASAQAQLVSLEATPTNIAANVTADKSDYTPLQRKSMRLVSEAEHLTQFMDRDTDPGFAADALVNGINRFLNYPAELHSVVDDLAVQARSIFPE